MGSTISSVIANVPKKELENSWDYIPHYYKRYLDDCILCIPGIDLELTHSYFNSYALPQFTTDSKKNLLAF